MSDHYNAFISYKHAEADIKVAEAIEKGLEFGYINFPKVENMKLQHETKRKDVEKGYTSVKPEKKPLIKNIIK